MTSILNKARQLAKKKVNTYHIAAAAYSRKGNLIDVATNLPCSYPGNRFVHAESRLMLRYGRKISKIVIVRVGHSGDQRPIRPCEECSKLASRLGIKIIEKEAS